MNLSQTEVAHVTANGKQSQQTSASLAIQQKPVHSAIAQNIGPANFSLAQEQLAEISDEQLFQMCRRYGSQALFWRQKFIGLLPEVNRRRLYEKKGCSSIFEFAKKLAGLSEEQVRTTLNIEKRFEDKPVLRGLLVTGEVSISKLARIASVATGENQEFWAAQVKLLPKNALETLVRDEKFARAGAGEQLFDRTPGARAEIDNCEVDGFQKPLFRGKISARADESATKFRIVKRLWNRCCKSAGSPPAPAIFNGAQNKTAHAVIKRNQHQCTPFRTIAKTRAGNRARKRKNRARNLQTGSGRKCKHAACFSPESRRTCSSRFRSGLRRRQWGTDNHAISSRRSLCRQWLAVNNTCAEKHEGFRHADSHKSQQQALPLHS